MNKYLSPKGLQETFQISKATAYRILKKYEQSGGEIIRIGRLTRVSEEDFKQFLRGKHDETHT